MLIRWLKNTTFLIQASSGRRILIDPVRIDSVKIKKLNPTIIISSLPNNISLREELKNINTINYIDSPSFNEINNISISTLLSYRDKFKGKKRGENIITKIRADNFTLVHLGWLSHLPSENILEEVKDCDLLFIPISSNFSFSSKEALEFIDKIKPKFIVPMLYKTKETNTYFSTPKEFLTKSKNVFPLHSQVLDTNSLKNYNTYSTLILNESNNFYSYLP